MSGKSTFEIAADGKQKENTTAGSETAPICKCGQPMQPLEANDHMERTLD